MAAEEDLFDLRLDCLWSRYIEFVVIADENLLRLTDLGQGVREGMFPRCLASLAQIK